MDIILQTYYLAFPIVLTAFLGWISKSMLAAKKADEKRKLEEEKRAEEIDRVRQANSRGMMLMMRYMLRRYHSEYKLQKVITYTQYKEWRELYEVYRSLDGNFIAKEWDEEVEALPKTDSIPNASPFEIMLQRSMEEEERKEREYEKSSKSKTSSSS